VFSEQPENIDRQDFTIEERVAIGEEIERLLQGGMEESGARGKNYPLARRQDERKTSLPKSRDSKIGGLTNRR
jgi:hypothetical protein